MCSRVFSVWSWLVKRERGPVDSRGGRIWQPGLKCVLSQWPPAHVLQGHNFSLLKVITFFFYSSSFTNHEPSLKSWNIPMNVVLKVISVEPSARENNWKKRYTCVCVLQMYSNGDSELDSKEFLNFLKHNESALNLTYSKTLETNLLLRYTLPPPCIWWYYTE